MTRSVLIAFSGSTSLEAIWILLTQTLERLDPVVELLAVGDSDRAAQRLLEQAQTLEDRLVAADLRARLSTARVGKLEAVAHEQAQRRNPALVVLVGEATIERSDWAQPVLVLPPGRQVLWLRRALIVLDDSPEYAGVVRAVGDVCRGIPCAVILVYFGAQGRRPKHMELALRRLELAGFYALLRRSTGDPLGALRDELTQADLVALSPARQQELAGLLAGRPLLLGGLPARASTSA